VNSSFHSRRIVTGIAKYHFAYGKSLKKSEIYVKKKGTLCPRSLLQSIDGQDAGSFPFSTGEVIIKAETLFLLLSGELAFHCVLHLFGRLFDLLLLFGSYCSTLRHFEKALLYLLLGSFFPISLTAFSVA
jgi:hypothetical protein